MILNEIASYAKERVKEDKKIVSFAKMKDRAQSLPKGDFCFEKAIKNSKPALICEVKKASPAKGIISEDFPYMKIASEYEQFGATCMSVLTEPKWFCGSDAIFREIRERVAIPILRKDFTVDEYQIYQSKVIGADCILLICALLDTDTLKSYLGICESLGISALVEAHDEPEIISAIEAGARIIGVNNRNLKDFTVNLNNASELRRCIPKDVIYVAESGILTPQDGINLVKSGADALLIGEALMKTTDKQDFIATIKEHEYEQN